VSVLAVVVLVLVLGPSSGQTRGRGFVTARQIGAARRSCGVAQVVYPAGVSDKPPQTYILHTVVLFVVLIAAMVAFLVHQWG
jgi:hypothetical protein